MHSKKTPLNRPRCKNPEINSETLEEKVWSMVTETMLDPEKLKNCIPLLQDKGRNFQVRFRRKLKVIDKKIARLATKKQRLIELYASGGIDRNAYVQKSRECDNETNEANAERLELSKQVPALHKTEVIDESIEQYCQTVRMRMKKCRDFESKRQFLLDWLESITYTNESVILRGSISIQEGKSDGGSKIEFRVDGKILRADRAKKYFGYGVADTRITLPQYNGFSS